MRKILISLFVLAFAICGLTSQAEAKYGLVKWYFTILDEAGVQVTDTATINVYTADTTTNATIYSSVDAASQSNSFTDDDGYFQFWSNATTLDIQVNVGSRGAKRDGVTAVSDHKFIITSQAVGLQKSILFTPPMFVDITTAELIDAGEAPTLVSQNSLAAIEWVDGETDKAQITFRVPYDYSSGGSFRVWADEDGGGAGTYQHSGIDFEVYVNADGTAFDTTATNQTPVALSGDPGSPEEKDLTVTTDFASLAAGDLVTLNIWRDDSTHIGDDTLEVYYVEFIYTATR